MTSFFIFVNALYVFLDINSHQQLLKAFEYHDTYGHKIGDLAIKVEAQVLKAAFRDSDVVGRLSGDEFGVVAPGFPSEKVSALREKLISLNEDFSKKNELPFTLSISVGAVDFDVEYH